MWFVTLTAVTTAAASVSRPLPPKSSAHNARVQTLRGLACFLLVMFHVVGDATDQGIEVGDGHPLRWLAESFRFLRMPLFTVLSGYVYAYRPVTSRPGRFLAKKARRLLVPLVVVGTFYAVVKTQVGNVSRALDVPFYLWHVIPVDHFWYLEALMWIFLLVTLIDVMGWATRRSSAFVWITTAALLSIGLGNDMHGVYWYDMNILGFHYGLMLLPFFLLGVFAHRFAWKDMPRGIHIAVGVCAAALFVVSQFGVAGRVPSIQGLEHPVGIVLSSCTCLVLLVTMPVVPWLACIGSYSYSIFLFHIFGVAGSRIVAEKLGVIGDYPLFSIGVVAGIGLPIVVHLVAVRFGVTRVALLGMSFTPKPKQRPVVTASLHTA